MRIAVIGAGIMGTGIAQVMAEGGCEVWLQSRTWIWQSSGDWGSGGRPSGHSG